MIVCLECPKPKEVGAGCELQFEVALDGRFDLQVWALAESAPEAVSVAVNGHACYAGWPAAGREGYFACGRVAVARGRHVLELAGPGLAAIRGILLTDDDAAIADGRATTAWENRGKDPAAPFDESRHRRLSEPEQTILRDVGLIFDHERDTRHCLQPQGVPLGGLGAGKIEITPQGFFTAITINNNQDCPIYRVPGCFFALAVRRDGGPWIARALQSVSTGQPFTPVERVLARHVFPEAELEFHDPALPVIVRLHAFSAHIPRDVAASALPCVCFRITLEPRAQEGPLEARILFSWENLINVGGHMRIPNGDPQTLLPLVFHPSPRAYGWSNRDASFQERRDDVAGGTALRFAARSDRGNPASFGVHLIWTPDRATAAPDRSVAQDGARLAAWLTGGADKLFEPTPDAGPRAGALAVSKPLPAAQAGSVDFVLAWRMPHWPNAQGVDQGTWHATRFASAADVVRHVWPRRDELLGRTQEVRNLLTNSTLPAWFQTALLDGRFPAATNSVLDAQGRFSINEAPTGMCGCLGTLDQRNATAPYWCTFFPELDDAELEMFRQCQSADGAVAHDIGFGAFEIAPRAMAWPDLAEAYVLQVHRHVRATGDAAFLARHWPHVRRALEWTHGLDETGDGIPSLTAGRGTTYDNQHWDGISSFVATMHGAALALGADLAARAGEAECARDLQSRAARCHAARMQRLWTADAHGPYMCNAFDPATGESDDSCFIASFAGEWALQEAGLPLPIDGERLRAGLEAIAARNFTPVGFLDQSARPKFGAFSQYPLAYYAGVALQAGLADLAWRFIELWDRMITAPPSTRYGQILTYTAEGKPDGLPYYMTAPAVWTVLAAIAGASADAAGGTLRLAPARRAGECRLKTPVFLATSWFTLECEWLPRAMRLRLAPARRFAPFAVSRLTVGGIDPVRVAGAQLNGAPTAFTAGAGAVELACPPWDPGYAPLQLELTMAQA